MKLRTIKKYPLDLCSHNKSYCSTDGSETSVVFVCSLKNVEVSEDNFPMYPCTTCKNFVCSKESIRDYRQMIKACKNGKLY